MISRRSVLQALGLFTIAPWSELTKFTEEKSDNKMQQLYLAAAKYAGYTDADFWKSKIVVFTTENKAYAAPKIEQVLRAYHVIELKQPVYQ